MILEEIKYGYLRELEIKDLVTRRFHFSARSVIVPNTKEIRTDNTEKIINERKE